MGSNLKSTIVAVDKIRVNCCQLQHDVPVTDNILNLTYM